MKRLFSNKTLVGLALLFAAQFLFVSPVGEFALNDDWVHTETLSHWVETGEFRMLPFAGPTFYTPIVYGAALTSLFGFSFTLLRLSTLALAATLLGLLFIYLQKETKKTGIALFAVLTLWLNPIFYNLSFTFMTDVPALFFLLASFLCFHQYLKQKHAKWLFGASLFSIIGFFTRQTNILFLVPVGIYLLFDWNRHKRRAKKEVLWFAFPILLGGATYLWLASAQLLPETAGSHIIGGVGETIQHAFRWLWQYGLYLGLFVSPLTLGYAARHPAVFKRKAFLVLLPLLLLVSYKLNDLWPDRLWHVGEIISVHGLGPMQVLQGTLIPVITPSLQLFWTLTSAALLALFVSVIDAIQEKKKDPSMRVLVWFGAIYFLTILLVTGFDRYLLPVLLVSIIWLATHIDRYAFSYHTALLVILFFGITSIAGTHHYLAWNSARWELANTMLYQNHDAEMIDAGYEWDGWHTYWSSLASVRESGPVDAPWWIRAMFVDNREVFVVSFSPLPGYDIVDVRRLETANPNSTIYLLKKHTPTES